ncbi:ThiF family adenylyltransferase [Tissierella sp. Yu-01]|uniref:ThiF family adenylyltransferase n=1 Tax=Tissierella sp. Yu-01 TaxID=3035694 RepID=UPI00240E4E1F|nr:ThiF family adenylyltransferase [Tissierella sp. Yu-01]WFA10004.1 ThiF family adenylyltransferase [Tissierella sp. Yu-01]
MERYEKQMLYGEIGLEGQKKLLKKKAIIIGCGALGTVIANNLVRSGVGYIKFVDRDYIEISNLQRQILFDEEDIKENLPKVIAAERKLKKINSDIKIEGIIADVNSTNVESLCEGMDVILDATDNLQTRYLINDISIKLNIPWVYGGVIGSSGMVHTIIPQVTPCLRCMFPEIPPIGSTETCDTAGVLNSITSIVASMESMEAIKILLEKKTAVITGLQYMDIWSNDFETIDMTLDEDCKTCGKNSFEFLERSTDEAVYLCGKNSIQINPLQKSISADDIINRLKSLNINVKQNAYFIKFNIEDVQVTLFYDGRAILKNTDDIKKATSLYARYIGN